MSLSALYEDNTRSARTAVNMNMKELKNILLKGLGSCLQKTSTLESSVKSAAHSRLIAAITSDFQPSTSRDNSAATLTSDSTEPSDMGMKNATWNSGSWVCGGVEEKSISDVSQALSCFV